MSKVLKPVLVLLCVLIFSSPPLAGRSSSGVSGFKRVPKASAYTVTSLGVLSPYTTSQAVSINNNKAVVGSVCCGQNLESVLNIEAAVYRRAALSGLGPFDPGIPGHYASSAFAINNHGRIVGSDSYVGVGLGNPCLTYTQAVAFTSSGEVPLGALPGPCPQSIAYGVNDNGEAVGWSSPEGSPYGSAVLFHNGATVFPGGAGGVANGINDAGIAVGTDGSGIATLFSLRSYEEIGTLGGQYSSAQAISNAGSVVGTSYLSNNAIRHAFIFVDRHMIDLGAPAGTDPSTTSSAALAVNNLNEVVGNYTPEGGTQLAFVYTEGVMQDLTSLIPPKSGWTLTSAAGINDCGDIVGTGLYQGQPLGYRLNLKNADHVRERLSLGCL